MRLFVDKADFKLYEGMVVNFGTTFPPEIPATGVYIYSQGQWVPMIPTTAVPPYKWQNV